MKSLSLYNQDGSLSPEAQFLLSPKPDDMSIAERRKRVKELKSLMSAEDLKQLRKLQKNKMAAKHRAIKRELRQLEEQELVANLEKVSLYNQDGSIHTEAQPLILSKPDSVSLGEWTKMLKTFKNRLSSEDCKKFERLRNNEHEKRWRTRNPEKAKQKKAYYRAKWYANNPEKAKENNTKWYAENKEKAREDNARWYAENTEKAKARDAKRYAENTEKAKAQNAKWYAENVDYWNDYYKQRRDTDPLFRLHCNMRSACTRVVKQLSLGKKPMSTFKWIGCSPEELKAHLESLFTEGMTWQNYGKWHVDHIRPVCSFTAEEWEQVNHYTNLRPLWAEDNLAKSVFDKLLKVNKESPTAL
jgi:hypothetical protein